MLQMIFLAIIHYEASSITFAWIFNDKEKPSCNDFNWHEIVVVYIS